MNAYIGCSCKSCRKWKSERKANSKKLKGGERIRVKCLLKKGVEDIPNQIKVIREIYS
jgi:hypothetical protein